MFLNTMTSTNITLKPYTKLMNLLLHISIDKIIFGSGVNF
jgi:hypothetical protein